MLNGKTILFLFIISKLILGQTSSVQSFGADSVIAFSPGKGQNMGQGSEYFPGNILGLPDTNASWKTPASGSNQICCLGMGGSITLGFIRHPIIDGAGCDFTVFENAFLLYTGKIFGEPAMVEISKDNISYFQFPYDSLTLKGCAGITPTNGKNNPSDPSVSGGDSFDISASGLDTVRYVRITDICARILADKNHPFFNPSLSGFDLDAAVAVHCANSGNTNDVNSFRVAKKLNQIELSGYPNPFNPSAVISYRLPEVLKSRVTLRIYDMLGKEITTLVNEDKAPGAYIAVFNASGLTSGIYIARIAAGRYSKSIKLSLVK